MGGIDTVYASSSDFYEVTLNRILAEGVLDQYNVIIAGGGKTIGKLKNRFKRVGDNLMIGCFPQDTYMSLLARSWKVITSPGLTSFYEYRFLDKDVFFLPPLNYSQHLQLTMYKDVIPKLKYMEYDESLGFQPIAADLPELEGISKVRENVEKFISNELALLELVKTLGKFLKADRYSLNVWRPEMSKANGATLIAEKIKNMLE